MVPDRLYKLITERAENCFIIRLDSGLDAHGQPLIYHDMFGLYPRFQPRMAKVFGEAGKVILDGAKPICQRGQRAELPAAGKLVRHARLEIQRATEPVEIACPS
jgi:3-methyl-2-oxobutanoate hydroxymethyltransferase